MKPNIFIVGPSGSGKSTSLRNLNPETTIILNTEQKALPFREGRKFKMNVPVADMKTFHLAFDKALISKTAKTIVIESFTSLVEHQYIKSKASYQNHSIWSDYKDEIQRVLNLSKGTDKYIVFLGLDAVLESANGVEERYIFVQGSLKKQVEKEFVMVLYTDMITNEGKSEYQFVTNKQEGYEHTGIKSPMDMLPLRMPNDIAEVIKHIEAYYSDDELEDSIKEEIKKDEAAVAEVCDEVTDEEATELIKGQEAVDQQMAQEAAANNSVSDEDIDNTVKGEPDFDLDFAPVANDDEEDVQSGDVDFDFA